MSLDHPTNVLRDEHEWILAVAGALEELFDAPEDEWDYHGLEQCIRFIRLFADACHHGKEEDLLFPTLQECGMPGDSGPIAVMLHEHRLGREAVSAMRTALPDAREGDADSNRRLENAGRGYVELIRGHIGKEDHVLFDMADQLVEGSRRSRLCTAYEGTCAHRFEGCTKRELEALGREILGDRASASPAR